MRSVQPKWGKGVVGEIIMGASRKYICDKVQIICKKGR